MLRRGARLDDGTAVGRLAAASLLIVSHHRAGPHLKGAERISRSTKKSRQIRYTTTAAAVDQLKFRLLIRRSRPTLDNGSSSHSTGGHDGHSPVDLLQLLA